MNLKNDLEDTKEELGADEVFLMELKKNCATKADEYEARKKVRGEELVAISETIKASGAGPCRGERRCSGCISQGPQGK